MATELPIIQCTLDATGGREQAARYGEVAKHVESLTHSPNTLVAAMDAEVDRDLMQELLDTERACCAFFEITWDGSRLTYSVEHPEHARALDVIAEALSA
jgi:hypothetical protein